MIIETLVALLLGLLTGCAILAMLQLTMSSRSATMSVANTDEMARAQLDRLADKLRNAQSVINGTSNAVLAAAGSSDVTAYISTTGDTLRLWLDTTVTPYVLKQTQVVGGVSTTTAVLSGVTVVTYAYYVQATSTYNAPLLSWLTSLVPGAPTQSEIPTLGACKIQLSYIGTGGASKNLSTFVRFRNSPYQ